MSEQQWQASDDPREMHALVKDRVTPKQMRYYVEACREKFASVINITEWDATNSQEVAHAFTAWIEWSKEAIVSKPWRADLLREIVPFHSCYHDEEGLWIECTKVSGTRQWRHSNDLLTWKDGIIPATARMISGKKKRCDKCQLIHGEWMVYHNAGPSSEWVRCDCNGTIEFPSSLLTWRDGVIPATARMISGRKECGECCNGSVVKIYGQGEHGDCEQESCDACDGSGRIDGDPQWSDMLILADQLEEAGGELDCLEAVMPLVAHCRKERDGEVCVCEQSRRKVLGLVRENKLSDAVAAAELGFAAMCPRCDGTGRRRTRHAKGCWVLELFVGG